MAKYKENINDILKSLKNEDYEEAKRILEDHIENEHHLDSDLSNLQRTVGFYQRHLIESKMSLNRLIHGTDPKQHDIDVVKRHLENAQMEIGFIEELIRKLTVEGKLAE